MASRTRPIRLTLTALLVIPLVSLVALWGYAGLVTLGPAIREHNYNTEYDIAGRAQLNLTIQLSQERLQSYLWLSSGRRAPSTPMDAQRKKTDAQVTAVRAAMNKAWGVVYAEGRAAWKTLNARLDNLKTIRNGIDGGTTSPLGAFQTYNKIIDGVYAVFRGSITVPDTKLYRESEGALQAAYALELAGREATLVGGAFVSRGQMSRAARELFVQSVAQQRYAISQATALLSPAPAMRAIWVAATRASAYAQFASMENQIVGTSKAGAFTPIPFSPVAFQQASQATIQKFAAAVDLLAEKESDAGRQLGNSFLLRLVLAGGVGLVAVAASIFLLIRFSRRISRELTGLRDAARDLADKRLPRLVERLRQGEDVNVAEESPLLVTGRTAEVAAVAQAFGTVQRTAAEAAVGQAELRKGVSQVFLNLARRNQSLLHRQLSALDVMERRTSEPDALEELFRLDHLTTRMRRHAESLIILSGNLPGRAWSTPVPAVDVVRAAVAEVEDYTRVDIACTSQAAVVGAAVADIIHMLAELVENATAFSPPNTKVTVRGEQVGRGFAVEVEDRGLGMEPEHLQAANKQLASRPEFDLAKSDQLGLFVVAQLAVPRGIRVSLRPNPYGGTTAIVLMPHSLLASEDDFTPPSAGTGGQQASTVPADRTGADGDSGSWPAGSRPGALSGGARVPGRHRTGPGNDAPEPPLPVGRATYAGGGLDTPGNPAATADELLGGVSAAFRSPPGQRAGHAGGEPACSPSSSSAGPPPAAPVPPSASSAASPVPSPDSGTYLGLPRRQRQASLVPQLRGRRPPEPGGTDQAGGPDGRSPEEARALMTSIHQGWQRGRDGRPQSSESPAWAGDDSWPGRSGLRAEAAADWPTETGGRSAFPKDIEAGDH
jgi:signal transduction histidine kinase